MNQQPNWTSIIQRHLDGLTTSEEAEDLSTQIVTSPEIREQYLKAAQLHAALTNEFLAQEHLEKSTRRNTPSQKKAVSIHLSATVGIAALLMISLLAFFWPKDRENEGHSDEWGTSIAKIEFLSEDALFEGDQELTTGSSLEKGWLQLAAGSARLKFRSGAIVTLEGPAAFGIDSPMRSYLEYGKVEVYAPESARDFVVATESLRVVDLGTRFEVTVDLDSQESNISVLEGLVDLHLGSPGTTRKIRPLEAGYHARVNAFGEIIEFTQTSDRTRKEAARLTGHWPLNSIDSGSSVSDSGPLKLHGSLASKERPKIIKGIIGNALKFSTGDSVDLSEHLPAISQLDSFTFSTWVCDPKAPLAMVFSLSGPSEQHRIQLFLSPAYVRYGWQDGAHFDSISGRIDGWKPDQWYHVAVTVKAGVARLYRNGRLIGLGSAGSKIGTPVLSPSLVKNPSYLLLGRLEDGHQGEKVTSQNFAGKLDDVRIYAGALRQNAIRDLYQNHAR